MNTEYRAWDKGNSEMLTDPITVGDTTIVIVPEVGDPSVQPKENYDIFESTPFSDSANARIFQGDLIRFNRTGVCPTCGQDWPTETGEVIFNDATGMWELDQIGPLYINRTNTARADGKCNDMTVIGNIKENPELRP